MVELWCCARRSRAGTQVGWLLGNEGNEGAKLYEGGAQQLA